MRRFALLFLLLAAAGAGDVPAFAQGIPAGKLASAEQPRWDINLTAGFFGARPEGAGSQYGDNWYEEGRYAVSAGYFWTTHLKTELEFAASSEGDRYVTRTIVVPGFTGPYPLNTQEFYRLQQASARVAWQFLDNAWVHPYVNAGFVFDMERRRTHLPEQFRYVGNDPRDPNNRIVIAHEERTGPNYEYRRGLTLGAGGKFFVSPNAYINTGVQWTHTRPALSFSWIGGIGVEF